VIAVVQRRSQLMRKFAGSSDGLAVLYDLLGVGVDSAVDNSAQREIDVGSPHQRGHAGDDYGFDAPKLGYLQKLGSNPQRAASAAAYDALCRTSFLTPPIRRSTYRRCSPTCSVGTIERYFPNSDMRLRIDSLP
jgi:hypothetical protein